MGTSLSGLTPATTFDGLLKVGDNDPLTADLKAISTGDGTDTILSLSNSALKINGTGNTADDIPFSIVNSDGVELLRVSSNNVSSSFIVPSARIANVNFVSGNVIAGNNTNLRFVPQQGGVSINKDYSNADSSTMLHIKGGGATSATTSLLVQNSAGTNTLKLTDDGTFYVYENIIMAAGKAIFSGDSGHGIYLNGFSSMLFRSNTKDFVWTTQNGTLATLKNDGDLGIGETTPTARLHIKGSGNDNTTTALLVQNSDGADMMVLDDSKEVSFRGRSGFYNGVFIVENNHTKTQGNAIIGAFATPNARLQVKGSGATSATTALLVQNSAGTDLLKVTDDGVLTTKQINTSGGNVVASYGNYYGRGFLGTNIFQYGASSVFETSQAPTLGTSGDKYIFSATLPFGPAGGSETLSIINASPTINQTGGANGITRGLYVNPTLTSAADFRSIETTGGKVILKSSGNDNTTTALLVQNSDGTELMSIDDDGASNINGLTIGSSILTYKPVNIIDNLTATGRVAFGTSSLVAGIQAAIKGSGNDATTTALLVQNSDAEELLKACIADTKQSYS